MKDSGNFAHLKHRKKRSRSPSESSDSSDSSSGSVDDAFPLAKEEAKRKSPETINISSDSESSLVIARKVKKKKKHKHPELSDLEERVQIIRDGHNGKRHRHRCHHHGHHRHHRTEAGHTSRDKEERMHKRTCTKHRMPQEVKIKEEPLDEDTERRQAHSSHRRPERRARENHNELSNRHERHLDTALSDRSRNHQRRENTYHRREDNGSKNEHPAPSDRPGGERRSEERNDKEVGGSRNGRRGVPEGRKNRWGSEVENPVNMNRPIKQEPSSDAEGEYEWGKKTDSSKDKKIPIGQKEKPNFGLSGKLTEDTNTFNGVVIKYSEPPEARKPKRRWRFYPFKGDKGLPTLYIHRQSSYLIGRDRKVADIPIDHPSCSKQHAALQYRLVPFQREDRTMGKRVRPYIIDLESSNGTFVNSVKIEPKTYVELLEKDVIKFGYSSREYVLLHEQSKDEELDDDVAAPAAAEAND